MQIQTLAAAIAPLIPGTGDGAWETAIPGLYLSRFTSPAAPRTTLDQPMLCVVAQGVKSVWQGDRRHVYAPGMGLVLSSDLPLVGQVVEATPEAPCLCATLLLDLADVGTLIDEAGLGGGAESADAPPAAPTDGPPEPGVRVTALGPELLDAVGRLVALLRTPAQVPVLAPLIRREIHYRLLLTEQSGLLRRLTAVRGQARHIAAGIDWLKRHAAEPVRMADLAREVHMSPSTMHAWFRAVTGMSPLQYQKQLRLREARRILLAREADAATASRRVGYESPQQFSREYRRLFGAPPGRDVARVRASGTA